MKPTVPALTLVALLSFGIQNSVLAATCSCAGVQLSNPINLMGLEPGQYQLGFSYTTIDISELVSGSEIVNDETGRKRKTESYLIQTSYGINDNWSVTGVISWVSHIRNVAISNTADETSSGIGDSLVVLSYAPQKIDPFTRNEWAFGIGLRIPTGDNDNGSPIIFAEDLQPGQGAWGSSIWFHYGHSFNQKSDWLFFIDGNFSNTKTNDREYSFESEKNLVTGFSFSSENNWSTNLSVTYRDADPHTRFASDIPNTGGRWIDFSPSFQYSITPEVNMVVSARIPISRELNGALQFTTKYSLSLSVNYLFK